MTIEPDDLRRVMRQWATGVTLVTCAQGEERQGMTVSSFTSVSLTPPIVLVSLEIRSATHALIARVRLFRHQHPGRAPASTLRPVRWSRSCSQRPIPWEQLEDE